MSTVGRRSGWHWSRRGAGPRWNAARAGLRAKIPYRRAASRALRNLVSTELLPEWPAQMPPPAPARMPPTARQGAAAVYLPSCINRIFGTTRSLSLPEALVKVSARAGHPVWIPPDVAGKCCATPWSSKGYRAGAAFMAARTFDAMWEWTDHGRLPVVTDASSCALGFAEDVANEELTVLDSIQWAHDTLLPDLQVQDRLGRAAVHPTCATRHLGLTGPLTELAGALAEDVYVPPSATCCGFAGDRGFLHPELPAAATADEAAELSGRTFDAYLCSNRTCEIGLQQGTGAGYESFVFALDQLTRPG